MKWLRMLRTDWILCRDHIDLFGFPHFLRLVYRTYGRRPSKATSDG